MDGDDENLSLLTSLLEENEGPVDDYPNGGVPWVQAEGGPDAFDELFDADGSGESYSEEVEDEETETTKEQKENMAYLFGDVGELTDEEEAAPTSGDGALDLRKTNQELQGELVATSFCRRAVGSGTEGVRRGRYREYLRAPFRLQRPPFFLLSRDKYDEGFLYCGARTWLLSTPQTQNVLELKFKAGGTFPSQHLLL